MKLKLLSRTTTNISLEDDDDTNIPDSIVPDEEVMMVDNTDDQCLPHIKRRRCSFGSGDQMRFFESISRTLKESQSKKLELIQQVVRPQSDLELFFASMCKTVERFDLIEQAKIKIEVSRIVSNSELAHLEKANNQNRVMLSVNTMNQDDLSNQAHSDQYFSFTGLPDQNVPYRTTNSNNFFPVDDMPVYISP